MTSSSWIAAVAGTAMLVTSLPATAQVARFDASMKDAASPLLTDVQFRGGGVRRFHGGGFRGGGFGHRAYGYGGGYHRGGRGGRGLAIGAGVAGLAAGALIGGALASQAAPAYGYGYGGPVYAGDPGYAPVAPTGDASAYCAQRFRSYDPASGTYLGYDGLRHPCP